MDLWLLAILQWLHVFFAIFWFGSVLAIDFLVIPTAMTLEPGPQQAFGAAFGARASKVLVPVGSIAITLGIVRGIAGGVLDKLDSAYGLTWIAAFVVGTGLLIYGIRVLTPAAEKLRTVGAADFDAALARIKRLSQLELGGFAVMLVFMIAMRFGY